MKLIPTSAAFLLVAFLWSCGPQSPETSQSSAPVITYTEIAGESAKTVALMSIEGMTCSHGCGGKIQQDLQALDGVKGTDLDYADGRDANQVMVEFDPAKVSETKLISCVNEIADGKYKVVAVEVQTVKAQSLAGGGSSDVDSEPAVDFSGFFQVFNLLSTFLNMIR
jgi:mercuric ion binding protein